ncbi:MAG: enoyl-CoA hydratase/isomerase family protein, partial [Alphaproteobacteria bacterium]
MTSAVLSECRDGVATITLNRPARLNAINPALVSGLAAALRAADEDAAVRAVVLRGAGRAFCAGDDLKEFAEQHRSPEEARAYVEQIQAVTRAISLGNKMVVGAIHGWAVGGGLEWVINCDLAIMAEGTRCFFPEIGLGVFVTGGVTTLLPKLVGLGKARELILFGERFDARAALAMGIAWKVVPEASLFAVAEETARRIASLPPKQVSDLKRVLNRAACL